MKTTADISLRQADTSDLYRVNAVIGAAVMTWNLPERVKRLSLPSYHCHAHDLKHLTLTVAETDTGAIAGIATWEPPDPDDTPDQAKGLLLLGLFVDPAFQRQGIGSRLLEQALEAARHGGFDGLLVKANPEARSFFAARGLQPLPVSRPERDYPHRYWLNA